MTNGRGATRIARWRFVHADKRAEEAVSVTPPTDSIVALVEAGKAPKFDPTRLPTFTRK